MMKYLRLGLMAACFLIQSCVGTGGASTTGSAAPSADKVSNEPAELRVIAPKYERLYRSAIEALEPYGVDSESMMTGDIESRGFYNVDGGLAHFFNIQITIDKSHLPQSATIQVWWNHFEPEYYDGTRFGKDREETWQFIGTVAPLQKELAQAIFDSYINGE